VKAVYPIILFSHFISTQIAADTKSCCLANNMHSNTYLDLRDDVKAVYPIIVLSQFISTQVPTPSHTHLPTYDE
jgi:hypothetical protein